MPDIAHVSGGSGDGVTTSLAGPAPPVVVPMPSAVAEQPTMEAIPLPMSERAELPTTLVASTTAGVAQPDEVPPIEAEVMVAMTNGS